MKRFLPFLPLRFVTFYTRTRTGARGTSVTANNQSATATATVVTSLPNPDSANATGFFLLVRLSSDFYQIGGGSAIARPQVSDGGLLAGQATGKGNLRSAPAETLRGRSVPAETLKGRKSVPSNDDKHPIQSDQEGGYSSGIIIPVPIYRVRNLVNFRYAYEILLPLDRYQDGNQAPDAGTEFRSAPAESLQGRRTISTRNHNNPSIIIISGSDNFPRQNADRMMTTFTPHYEVSHKPSQICYQILCPHFNLNLLMTPTISDLSAVLEVNGIRQAPEKSGRGQHDMTPTEMLKQVPEKSGRGQHDMMPTEMLNPPAGGQHDIVPHNVILNLFQDPATRDSNTHEIFRFGYDDDGHEVLRPAKSGPPRRKDDKAHEIYRFGYDDDGHEVLIPITSGKGQEILRSALDDTQYSLHHTQFSIPPLNHLLAHETSLYSPNTD